MRDYKNIVLDLNRPLKTQEIKIINELNLKFNNNDVYLGYKKRRIILNIHSLDFNEFKATMKKLQNKYHIPVEGNFFLQIIEKIEKIKSYGIKGKKRIFVDYNKERKVQNRKGKEKERGVYFYTKGHAFNQKNNELPDKFNNVIVCGDSKKVLEKLPDNCIDLIFTSPPYNFGLEYNKSEDGIMWEKYFNKLFDIFNECIRVLKYSGRIIVNVQPLFSDYIPIHHIISNFFINRKLIWKGEIVWEKNNYNCKYTAWGSWKSPSSPYLKYTWEFLEIFSKGELKKEGEKENIDITADEFKKWVVAKWSVAPERNMKKYDHPAMFPEELAVRVLKLFSYKNDIILDPFNGVGTTTAVAKKLGRRYLGIDISKDYCRKATRRLQETLL